MANTHTETIEGVFFIHREASIRKDWCPFCKRWTKFANPVNIKMDHVEKRKMHCGHEITYIFLVEQVCGENVKTVRRRVC